MSSKPAGQQYCYYPSGGGSSTPTPTPTTRPSVAPSASPKVTPSPSPSPIVAASCRMIVMYTTAWKPLTDFSTFKTGNQFYMCTYGSANTGEFTKARFTVNAELRAETTLKMPGTTNYFCDLYTVPAKTYDFVVTSEVYHSILGWRQ